MNDHQGALADIQHQHPDWRSWRGQTGTWYAIRARHHAPDGYQLRASTPAALAAQIRDADDQGDDPPITILGAPAPRPATPHPGQRPAR